MGCSPSSPQWRCEINAVPLPSSALILVNNQKQPDPSGEIAEVDIKCSVESVQVRKIPRPKTLSTLDVDCLGLVLTKCHFI